MMLHGVGSSGNDLAPLAKTWKDSLPGAIFVSPNAPSRSSFGSGYQWFSVAGVTEDNRSMRIKEARTAFDATISGIIEENGFSDRLDRVAFVGFSQGTIMALDAIASGRWPVGAIVGFSGRLASPLPLQAAVSAPVLLVHGSADPVIPAAETTKAAAVLQQQGVKVETLLMPGLGHTISADGAAHAVTFLASAMAK
jgi:phospholipase/carboxylesterase